MAKKNNSFKNFISKLESIDIQDLYKKAQSIKVEDIRNIKWKNFYKTNFFFISIGLLSTIFSASIFLIPSIKKSNVLRIQANLFKNESKRLYQVVNEANKSISLRDEIDFYRNEISRLLIDKNSLIFLPRILDEAAKRSNISLIEIRPIQSNEILCFYSDENRLNINSEFNQDKTLPTKEIRPEINDNFQNFNELKVNQTTNSKRSKVLDKRLVNLFTKESNQISNLFKSNFYNLNLNGNYLDALTFLKLIQEYNVIIYPVCFEPKSTFSKNMPYKESELTRSKNELNIKLIINVPTNKNVR